MTTKKQKNQSQQDVTILSETFRLLGDPSRLKILLHCIDGSKSLVSHHLRLLRGARLVVGVRQSKQVFYEIADSHVSDMLLDMITHIEEEHDDH